MIAPYDSKFEPACDSCGDGDRDLGRGSSREELFCAILSKKLASSRVLVALLGRPPSKWADRGG